MLKARAARLNAEEDRRKAEEERREAEESVRDPTLVGKNTSCFCRFLGKTVPVETNMGGFEISCMHIYTSFTAGDYNLTTLSFWR